MDKLIQQAIGNIQKTAGQLFNRVTSPVNMPSIQGTRPVSPFKPISSPQYTQAKQMAQVNPMQSIQNTIKPIQIQTGKMLQNFKTPDLVNNNIVKPLVQQAFPVLKVADKIGVNTNPLYGGLTNIGLDSQIQSAGRTLERVGQGKFASKGNRIEDIGNAAAFLPMGRIAKLAKSAPEIVQAATKLKQLARPEDIKLIQDFAVWVDRTGGKADPIKAGFTQDFLPTVQAIAKDLYGSNVENLNNKQLANIMDATLKNIGGGKNNFNLGLSVGDVRGGNNPLRTKVKTGSYSNLKAADNRLAPVEPLPWEQPGYKATVKPEPRQFISKESDNAMLREAMGGEKDYNPLNKLNPLRKQTPDVQRGAIEWDRAKKVAQVSANDVANTFKTGLNSDLEWKLVQYSQNPTASVAKKLGLTAKEITENQKWLQESQKYNDEIFRIAKENGIDLNYLQNHIYQVFKETPEQIDNIFKAQGLGSKPGFANSRTIDNFMEGTSLGLTPKYTTFGQLNAAAKQSLDNAIANKQFFDKLVKSGQLLPESKAPASWRSINAPFFPKDNIVVGEGQSVIQSYKAPPELANFLNNLFGGQPMGAGDKLLAGASKVSKVAQDVVLSGGIGPLNFFGLGQLIKEGTAGRIVHPLRAFMRAYLPGANKAFEIKKSGIIKEMASQGIKIRGVANYQTIYKNVVADKGIGELIGEGWSKVINEPTFGKFLSELQISYFEDVKNAALKSGLSKQEAIELAASSTKKFYGLSDTLGRSQGLDDGISAVLLAPKYRESMVNIFTQMGKGLLDPRNWNKAEYRGLQRLAAGMAITFGLYNVAQQKLTGKYMWDNPPGKEFELVIPVGDPKDQKYLSVPFMPGFTAVPRRIAGTVAALAKGDVKEAAGQAGGLLSIPAGIIPEVIRNKDYFGNEIMGDKEPLKDLAVYGAGKLLPGYGRAALNVASGKSTPAFGAVQALELPIRKGTFPNQYYAAVDEALKQLPSEKRANAEFLIKSDKAGGPDSESEAKLLLADDELLQFKKQVSLGSNPSDPLWSRSDADIKAYLAYRALADDNGTDTKLKAQIRLQNPWIPQVQVATSQAMYNSQQAKVTPTAGYNPDSVQGKLGTLLNPAKPVDTSKFIEKPNISPIQQLSEEQVKVVSAYTAAEKGSLARKQLLAQNPWLKTYWDANSAYYAANPIEAKGPLAEYLKSIGIDPNSASGSAFAFGPKKPKKIKFRKVKKVAMAKSKKIKLKKIKPLSFKVTKLKKLKVKNS